MSVRITRTARNQWTLTATCRIERPRDVVFPFFADAANLERITPPSVRFRILTPTPIEMNRGVIIDYALRVKGLPLKWRTEITAWEPPRRFVDTQTRGPYRLWEHEHRFDPADDGHATIMTDTVRYSPRGGALINRLFVQRDVKRIFAHRNEIIKAIFEPAQPETQPNTQDVAHNPGVSAPTR